MHEKIHVKAILKTKILYEQCNKGVFGAFDFAGGRISHSTKRCRRSNSRKLALQEGNCFIKINPAGTRDFPYIKI